MTYEWDEQAWKEAADYPVSAHHADMLRGPTRRGPAHRELHLGLGSRRLWPAPDRGAPGQQPWSRLHGFGPAFFTKFLYFSTPGALTLDNRLANAVHGLSQLPNLVTGNGQSLAWTPYRYSVYLHWMTQATRAVGVKPELLELNLFQPPGDLNALGGSRFAGDAAEFVDLGWLIA